MKVLLRVLFILVVLCPFLAYCEDSDSLLTVLKTEISKKDIYEKVKKQRIQDLKKQQHAIPRLDYAKQYDNALKLYEEYKAYQYDSAYVYVNKLKEISAAMKDEMRINYSQTKLGFILLSSGMFKDAFEAMHLVNSKALNDTMRKEYYFIMLRCNGDLAKYNSDRYYSPGYTKASSAYTDSALSVTKPGSADYIYYNGLKLIGKNDYLNGSKELNKLMAPDVPISMHLRAMIACSLGVANLNDGKKQEGIDMLIRSAIADIKSSTHETVALYTLAEQLYKTGNVKDAYAFIQLAKADADFYGARQRKIQIGAILPVLAAEELNHSEREKRTILIYLGAITALASLVIIFLVMIYKQLNKLKHKESIIEEKGLQLKSVNNQLLEDARIKEEYIGQFFKIISGYILNLEKLKMSVDTKLSIKKYDDIRAIINAVNIKKEREVLYHSFDHIFLKIFPNFIAVFNSQFEEKDQIWPHEHEALNTDLRIFALIRMGINDNETIAKILEYSVNTIYVYKMRIKAKAKNPELFEQRIMDIKAVDTIE
ncbi:MAG: tetratricopeptide repeat protein [Mucilaginibacter sp.]|nr:tetratricopeptide repeat protein [Mucilaginibacter sp.]